MNEVPKVSVLDIGRKCLVLRWIDPESRQQKQQSARTNNRREAERKAALIEEKLSQGICVTPSRIGWEAFREKYARDKLESLANGSMHAYEMTLDKVETMLNPLRLAELNSSRIAYFQTRLRKQGLREASIAKHLRHLKAALRWAHDHGMMQEVPVFHMPKRAKNSKLMRGRPVSQAEFIRMLRVTKTVVGGADAKPWRFYLRGMWFSGFRLSESLQLYWDRSDRLSIDLTGEYPLVRIPAEFEKGNQDRLMPLAPEFCKMLLKIPQAERFGAVFKLPGLGDERGLAATDRVCRVVSRIGIAADVKVDVDAASGKIKFASVHDLRRSFGERWASRLEPTVLSELMRHSTVQTTMKYYVGRNAHRTAKILWDAIRATPLQRPNDTYNDGAIEEMPQISKIPAKV